MLLPKNFTWSFSKLTLYADCPYAFYLTYAVPDRDMFVENAFSQYGTFGHALLESYARGQLNASDLAKEWEEHYPDHVTASFPPFPKGFALKSYEAGLEYFRNFKGFGDVEILEVEDKFRIHIGPYPFTGIADLVYRDSEGRLTVVDHKSKSAASMKREQDIYRRQLYIYAEHVYQKYGEYPEILKFNMFKAGGEIVERFSLEEHRKALSWAQETIEEIIMEDEFPACPNSYRCQFICSVREICDSKE